MLENFQKENVYTGDQCYDEKIFSPKNCKKQWASFAQITYIQPIVQAEKNIVTLVFQNRHFFRRVLAKIAETCVTLIIQRKLI
jgi:hypothetical protein